MKKVLGLLLAGAMVLSMSVFVFASNYDPDFIQWMVDTAIEQGRATSAEDWYKRIGSDFVSAKEWAAYLGEEEEDDADAVASSGGASVEIYDTGSEAAALEAEAMGLSMGTLYYAAEANKSVGEFMNNSVNSAPGLDHATPVAQGGNVIINGVPSNQTFSVDKPLPAHVDAAKSQAAALGGSVKNVVDIDGGVQFTTATVNFYTPGITGEENIQVYHLTQGQWTPVNVAEVRQDHIVVDMTAYGILAFIEVPEQ